MATGQYVGVNGVARKVTSPYVGVNGVARNVKSGYVGVDGVARLFFAPESGGAVVLEVAKITGDTYANDTTYTAEEFILLDIYPKTGGTVSVTYGGLTKTIMDTSGAAEPNAQRVYFGTFNGVSDSVATPASGELVIEGKFVAFGCGTYSKNSKGFTSTCACVTALIDFGAVETIPTSAFSGCTGLTNVDIPDSVTTIGSSAFSGCTGLSVAKLPNELTYLGNNAFNSCGNININTLPDKLTYLGDNAFLIEDENADFDGAQNDASKVSFTFSTLPSGLTYIGNSCCEQNDVIKTVDALNNLTAIGAYAFGQCSNLTKVVIGNNVTTIGNYAFSYSNSLTDITIGTNVAEIGKKAFYTYAENVKITFLSSTPPTFADDRTFGALIDNSIEKIIVPKSCSEAYKTALSKYADYIVEAI